jgi:endonuclease YncB( thermonuclease family)
VLDGDTFCAGVIEVRVADLDAPERGTREGKAATGALVDILRGQVLTCEARGTSFDRVVAICRLDDGRALDGLMIASGTAKAWTGRKRETPLPAGFD